MNERNNPRRRARTAPRGAAASVAAAVLLVGCTTKPPTKPPVKPKPTTFEDQVTRARATAPDSRPWFCNSVGTGVPPSGHGNGSHVNPYYKDKTKGPLDWDTCRALAGQLDTTLGAVQGLETRAKGEAAGWMAMADYIPGLGTHHGKLANIMNSTFDPAKPTFLIYGGKGKDAPLVGVAYRVPGNPTTVPEGYIGGNDWYHAHHKICITKDLAGGEELTDEQCQALGGVNTTVPGGGDLLLHVWLIEPYEYRPDIFVSGHPCLKTGGIAPFTDPCWDVAHRDPSLGPPPMPGSGDHDGGDDHSHP